jgi:Reverse transcriptase (RNA-dependent DNA polymerase)
LNARGYEQVDGEHYDEDAKAAPVVSEATIHIVLILIIMAGWCAEVLDVKGAFLHGTFEKGRQVYMEVPQGFERFYPSNCVLLLLKTLYGTKQAAKAFWLKLLEAFKSMNYARSKADPCLYFAWTMFGLVIWLSWVDDCLVCGTSDGVRVAKRQMQARFDCDEVGELKEYIGCKIDRNWKERWTKLTQPVLMQSFVDEFILPEGEVPKTPATPGEVLQKEEPAKPDAECRAECLSIWSGQIVAHDEMDSSKTIGFCTFNPIDSSTLITNNMSCAH